MLKFAINSMTRLRFLILIESIPTMVYELYLLLANTYSSFASSITRPGYVINPFILNTSSFVNSTMKLLTISILSVSILGLVFVFLHHLNVWGFDFRAIYLMSRSRHVVIKYLLMLVLLSTLYGFLLGTAVSTVIALALIRFLGFIHVMPILPGELDIIGAMWGGLWMWAVVFVVLLVTGTYWVYGHVNA